MKGLNLCFGLLLLCSITLLSSLCVSSNTNALSYPIDSIPFSTNTWSFRSLGSGDDSFYGVFTHYNDFRVSFVDDGNLPAGLSFPHSYRFIGDYDSSSDSCHMPAVVDSNGSYYTDGFNPIFSPVSNTWFYYGANPYAPLTSDAQTTFNYQDLIDPVDSPFDLSQSLGPQISPDYRSNICYIHGYDYTDTSSSESSLFSYLPQWNFHSLVNIPLVNNRLSYEASKPYTYNFDRIYFNGSFVDDGLIYRSDKLSSKQLFGVTAPGFSSLYMNFDDFTESGLWLSDYDDGFEDNPVSEDVYSFSLNGSILFDSDFTVTQSSRIVLSVENFYNPSVSSSDLFASDLLINNSSLYSLSSVNSDIECSISESHSDPYSLSFSCPYDPISANAYSELIDFRFLNISLNFYPVDDSSRFFTTSGEWYFSNFEFVTNGNNTPAGWSGSSNGTGGDIDNAPGIAPGTNGEFGTAEPDFLSSFINLFGFSFINPFAPIFNLFSDQSSCASIPTIAGMLSTDQTQVCPWFDSSIRNVTTPVFSFVSIMLLFGFLVRWLGARSGNFVEDSGGVDSGGYHFENRFRRKNG